MSNPWLKKNPFMSMWLSTANRVGGSLRGQVAAQAKRQVTAAAKETTDQSVKAWFAKPLAPARKKTRKR